MINTATLRIEDSDEILLPPWSDGVVISGASPQHPANMIVLLGSPRKLEELAHVLLVAAAELEREEQDGK